MKEIELKDGRTIHIKPMDKSFIIPGGEGRCPANCDMREAGDMAPTVKIRTLTEKMIERYGTSAILAMDKDLVIGFVSFFPEWVACYGMCSDEQIDEAVKHLEDIDYPPSEAKPVLQVNCLIVKERYCGNHLSVHLLEYLKEWARDRGWMKIIANGCIFSGRAQYQWLVSPKPPKCIWEKAGFLPGEDFHVAKVRSSYETARMNREWYRTYEFPGYVPRDVDPDAPDWYEIFSEYTMICEL